MPSGTRVIRPPAGGKAAQTVSPVDEAHADDESADKTEPLPGCDAGDRGLGPGWKCQHPPARHDALQSDRRAQKGVVDGGCAAGAHTTVDIIQFGCWAGLVRQFLHALIEFGESLHGARRDKIFSRSW